MVQWKCTYQYCIKLNRWKPDIFSVLQFILLKTFYHISNLFIKNSKSCWTEFSNRRSLSITISFDKLNNMTGAKVHNEGEVTGDYFKRRVIGVNSRWGDSIATSHGARLWCSDLCRWQHLPLIRWWDGAHQSHKTGIPWRAVALQAASCQCWLNIWDNIDLLCINIISCYIVF